MANETSAKVKVYPCAYRGQVEQSGVTYLYNPESRLPTEHNITEAVNNVSTVNNGSYIISPAAGTTVANDTPFTFVIHGYRFELDNISTALSSLSSADHIYALIRLAAKNPAYRSGNTDYDAMSLVAYSGTGELDSSGTFTGLEFLATLPTELNNIYYLEIARKVSGTWKTPSSSYLRLDATNIQQTADKNIGEEFTTGKATITGNETVGGTLGVTGATTLSSTLDVAGKATLGDSTNKSGVEVYGSLNVNGPINANPYEGSLTGQIKTGRLTIDSALGGIDAPVGNNSYIGSSNNPFAKSYITNGYISSTYTDSINRLASSGNIGVNSNIQLNSDASIIPDVDVGYTVSRSKIGDSNHNFSGIYGKLHGTIQTNFDGYATGSGFVDDGKALKVDANSIYIIEYNTELLAPSGYTGVEAWNTLGIIYTGTTSDLRHGPQVIIFYTYTTENGLTPNATIAVRPETAKYNYDVVLRIKRTDSGTPTDLPLYADNWSYIRLMKLTSNG